MSCWRQHAGQQVGDSIMMSQRVVALAWSVIDLGQVPLDAEQEVERGGEKEQRADQHTSAESGDRQQPDIHQRHAAADRPSHFPQIEPRVQQISP